MLFPKWKCLIWQSFLRGRIWLLSKKYHFHLILWCFFPLVASSPHMHLHSRSVKSLSTQLWYRSVALITFIFTATVLVEKFNNRKSPERIKILNKLTERVVLPTLLKACMSEKKEGQGAERRCRWEFKQHYALNIPNWDVWRSFQLSQAELFFRKCRCLSRKSAEWCRKSAISVSCTARFPSVIPVILLLEFYGCTFQKKHPKKSSIQNGGCRAV